MPQGQPVLLEAVSPAETLAPPLENPASALQSDSTINYQCTFKEETPPEERPPVYVRVPISQATRADVRCVMASLTFDIVNGDEYAESMEDESLKLPKPDGSFKCNDFVPPRKGESFDTALAKHHKKCLEQILPVHKDGFDVRDLSHMRKFLNFYLGNRKYTGSLQCAVVPGHADDEDVACNIRVGFVQRDPAHFTEGTAALSAGSEKISLESHEPRLVMSMLAAIFMSDVPLDFVSTDGTTYNLYRFHDDHLLRYENLTAEEAFYAVAQRLKHRLIMKVAMGDTSTDRLKMFPRPQTDMLRIAQQRLFSDQIMIHT
ncbi:g7169 [Coccomyxa viridis]|uniref:G7169 protein n=1 Tax=Coccomyxa viridis TaxID=1274662 RepID=A0ABP1G3T7_9CHLO